MTVWSAGSMPIANRGPVPYDDPVDAGIYLIKGGKTVDEPGQMLLIKNDPKYNEQWPRPLVPYQRIYGIDEPAALPALRNDGKLSHAPAGRHAVRPGRHVQPLQARVVPARRGAEGERDGDRRPVQRLLLQHVGAAQLGRPGGRRRGCTQNSDIHAIRILALEPATLPVAGRFYNHAFERLRILGEIPVRKFGEPGASATGGQPLDPDGNPDTSFLAKIPADVAFTFQTLDKDGMVLNMAQTWHQVRPGEVRNNCGGCHAHSQQPTDFHLTRAARPDYAIFDLTKSTPLLTSKERDQSKRKWDARDETGLRFEPAVKDVEYHRDIQPIFQRSCVACHSGKLDEPAGKLVLDDDKLVEGTRWDLGGSGLLPATYKTLAGDYLGVTKYVHGFQSRRSLLIWKVFGKRLDGFPAEPVKGSEGIYKQILAQGDFKGSMMPPPDAVKSGKVASLTDEDRRTLVRWIDLGCPVDKAFDPKNPQARGDGWLFDDQRPTLTVTYPRAGANEDLSRILVGTHDYNTGLDLDSFQVVADFSVGGLDSGTDLASRFKATTPGVWELRLAKPITALAKGMLTVSIKDRQGNVSRVERTFWVGKQTRQ